MRIETGFSVLDDDNRIEVRPGSAANSHSDVIFVVAEIRIGLRGLRQVSAEVKIRCQDGEGVVTRTAITEGICCGGRRRRRRAPEIVYEYIGGRC